MKKLVEQILSLKSRSYLLKDFHMQDNEKATTIVPLCKNDRKGQIFPYYSDLSWRCIYHREKAFLSESLG